MKKLLKALEGKKIKITGGKPKVKMLGPSQTANDQQRGRVEKSLGLKDEIKKMKKTREDLSRLMRDFTLKWGRPCGEGRKNRVWVNGPFKTLATLKEIASGTPDAELMKKFAPEYLMPQAEQVDLKELEERGQGDPILLAAIQIIRSKHKDLIQKDEDLQVDLEKWWSAKDAGLVSKELIEKVQGPTEIDREDSRNWTLTPYFIAGRRSRLTCPACGVQRENEEDKCKNCDWEESEKITKHKHK